MCSLVHRQPSRRRVLDRWSGRQDESPLLHERDTDYEDLVLRPLACEGGQENADGAGSFWLGAKRRGAV